MSDAEADAAYNNYLKFNTMYGIEPGELDGHKAVMDSFEEVRPRKRTRSTKDKQVTDKTKSKKHSSSNKSRNKKISSTTDSGASIDKAQREYFSAMDFLEACTILRRVMESVWRTKVVGREFTRY